MIGSNDFFEIILHESCAEEVNLFFLFVFSQQIITGSHNSYGYVNFKTTH